MSRPRYAFAVSLALAAVFIAGAGRVRADGSGQAAPASTTQTKPPASAETKLTQAERILRLEEEIQKTRTELERLKKELEDPEGEYAKSKADFTRIDKRLKDRELELTTQPEAEPGSLDGLRKARETAKERFDLAIQDHDALQDKYTLLTKKLEQDLQALAKLRAPGVTTSQPAAASAPADASVPAPGVSAAPAVTAQPPGAAIVAPPAPAAPQAAADPAKPADATKQPVSKELLEAQKKAQQREAEAKKAEENLEDIAARVATLRESIQTEQRLLKNAREQAANAHKSFNDRRDYVQKLTSTGASAEDISRAWALVDEAEARAAKTEKEVNDRAASLDELTSDLTDLQSEHIALLQEAEGKRAEAAKAEQEVKRLQNPYSLFRILQWTIDHGPPILGILIGAFVLLWLMKVAENRIVHLIVIRGGAGNNLEKESRAKTLASVFRNVGSTAIVVGAMLMVLSEVNIDIVPLLGAAGVVGLAVAFGAQSLIKDYFSGFIILLENQYAINDVIRIGDTAGLVEHISLRMTVLRDVEGNAHFIPHGEIKSVTNMTHGWSRAVFDVGVAYKEQVDQVMKVLMELAREIRRDPAFAPFILDDPEMLGVDSLGDSAVVIKFFIKTRPLRQWTVRREMLRRIKNRFDELGIEIPFPHRTVYHRYEPNGQSEALADGVLAPLGARQNQHQPQ